MPVGQSLLEVVVSKLQCLELHCPGQWSWATCGYGPLEMWLILIALGCKYEIFTRLLNT